MTGDTPTVLVVDDEPAVADGHAARLEERYEVRTAYSGRGALEQLDAAVDVALLDRRLPDLQGEEVLERLRADGLPCRVAMLTAVDPSFDIVDMGFDGYLQKPVSREALFQTVETLLQRAEYDAKLQEFFSVASKVAVLRTRYDRETLADHDEFARLSERQDRLREELDEQLEELPPKEGYIVATGGTIPVGDARRAD